jgi:hypothetical protein
VVSWAGLVALLPMLSKLPIGCVIYDEAHYAKSSDRVKWEVYVDDEGDTQFEKHDRLNRSAAAARLAAVVPHRILTTATPTKNLLQDWWGLLNLVERPAYGHKLAFEAYGSTNSKFLLHYCNGEPGPFGGIVTHPPHHSNVDELRERVTPVRVRIPYKVLSDQLPPKRRRVQTVPLDAQDKSQTMSRTDRQAYRKALRELAQAERKQAVEGLEIRKERVTVWRLQDACNRKKTATVDLICDTIDNACGSLDDPSLPRGKVLVFFGLVRALEVVAQRTKKKRPHARVWVAHGGGCSEVDEEGNLVPTDIDTMKRRYMSGAGPAVVVGTYQYLGECMPPETWIVGANKAIGDLAVGDTVLSQTGRVKVLATSRRKAAPGEVYEIKATGLLPIVASGNHPILVRTASYVYEPETKRTTVQLRDPEWVRTDELKTWAGVCKTKRGEGHFMLIPKLEGVASYASPIQMRDYYASSASFEKANTRGLPSSVRLTPAVAWLMGLYVAEGCLKMEGKVAANVVRGIVYGLDGRDDALHERVVQGWQELGFNPYMRPKKNNGRIIGVNGTGLGNWFRSWFGHNSHEKRIPDEILRHQDLDVVRAFLAGYIKGDGWDKDGHHQAVTVSPLLVRHLQLLLARLSIFGAIHKVKHSGTTTIQGRTYETKQPYHIQWRTTPALRTRYKDVGDALAVPVMEHGIIDYTGDLVDITTEDHTFLASNAIVHNSHNMQDTDSIIVGMLPYTPGEVAQIEGRGARLGQARPLDVVYLVAEGTIDERSKSIVLGKLPAVSAMGEGAHGLDGLDMTLRGIEDLEGVLDAFLESCTSEEEEDEG